MYWPELSFPPINLWNVWKRAKPIKDKHSMIEFEVVPGIPEEKQPYRFFQNKECQFFPCHDEYKDGIKDIEDFNCLFCYCPVYFVTCPGEYERLPDGRKDCMGCSLNHEPRFWDMNMSMMKNPKKDSFPNR